MANRKRLVFFLIVLIVVSVLAGLFDYEPLFKKWSSFRPWQLGLDLAGGSFLIYEIDLNGVEVLDRDSVVRGLRDVVERRVNLFGVREPKVYTEESGGASRLVVELAGVGDVSEAIKQIGETPFLEFQEIVSSEGDLVAFAPTGLTGRYVKGAQLGFDQITREAQVFLEFTSEGAGIFEEVTGRNVGKPLCIFLDGELRSVEEDCPIVQTRISGGNAQITGRFTIDEARGLVERFNAGALPAPIRLINQQTIGADFGKDALQSSVFAGIVGTGVIILFMMLYYRRFGIFAALALLMYVALTLAVFKIIPITLTLAGIAGFLLSIGMAVDANILVFERTKEEIKKGLARVAAIEEGFRRAWPSIRDSNIATMISSVVLYYFTSSFVQGFALALFIGVVVSMFSAVTITRTLLRVFIK
ncbi:MAG: protein translocase subunit SecD [Candidatus Brennerbacteria bacterium]|nr:protein translocase subunit SecD [Candidatus Brennerbacteria bacterium]